MATIREWPFALPMISLTLFTSSQFFGKLFISRFISAAVMPMSSRAAPLPLVLLPRADLLPRFVPTAAPPAPPAALPSLRIFASRSQSPVLLWPPLRIAMDPRALGDPGSISLNGSSDASRGRELVVEPTKDWLARRTSASSSSSVERMNDGSTYRVTEPLYRGLDGSAIIFFSFSTSVSTLSSSSDKLLVAAGKMSNVTSVLSVGTSFPSAAAAAVVAIALCAARQRAQIDFGSCYVEQK